MPKSDVLDQSATRVELDQRSRDARLRLECVERLLAVRDLPRQSLLRRFLRCLRARTHIGGQIQGRSMITIASAGRASREREPAESGGGPRGVSLAMLMSRVLQEDFRVPVQWREERSRNTFENALYSAEILRGSGIHAALVIAHPWDMARALWSFRAVGYPVVPSPIAESKRPSLSVAAFLPQIPALLESYYTLHELIGLVWYRVRYGHR